MANTTAIDSDMVFETMNKYAYFQPMIDSSPYTLRQLTNFVLSHHSISNVSFDECQEQVRHSILPKRMTSAYNMMFKIVSYIPSRSHLITFEKVANIKKLMMEHGLILKPGMPIILYKCVFDVIFEPSEFDEMVSTYYNAYGNRMINKERFCTNLKYLYFSAKNTFFMHQIDNYLNMYDLAGRIARSYKSYRMRTRLPVVANKARLKDEIEYRPLTGIKYFEALSFFENKEFMNS
jgi:hypothetical protein